MLDLTPFGYTPTESAAYRALLNLGPSSGYAVAKHLSVARANTYQALDALEARGAAVISGETPRVYRAVAPDGLLAKVTHEQAEKLDRLEAQLVELEQHGEPATVRFAGERKLDELVLRTAARAEWVRCFASENTLRRLVPIWRKREQDQASTELTTMGPPPAGFPVRLAGAAAPGAATYFDGSVPFLLLTSTVALVAIEHESELAGLWSTDPLLRGLVQAAADTLAG